MEAHHQLTNAEFEQQFATCQLDSSLFSHEAHLRLAWIHIQQYGQQQAEINIQKQLQDFVASLGATDKYHATLTVAAVRIVGHFIKNSSAETFSQFMEEYPRLKTAFKGLVEQHYSFDIFSSDAARSSFVEPDLVAF